MRSTFAGFNTAALAMKASQRALDVTGQNIANVNTAGYTRQRLDLMSFHTGMGPEKYRSKYNVSVGNGVLITGISQIRDPYLDIRFRNEMSNVGGAEQKANILKQLEDIFDEVDKEKLQNNISELSSALQQLSGNVESKEFDSIVRATMSKITSMLNQYANQLDTLKAQTRTELEDIDVRRVNDILKDIEGLNKSIKRNNVYGSPALELVDKRNELLDELSSYMDINIERIKVPIAGDPTGQMIEVLKVTHKSSGAVLIDDNKSGSITYGTDADGKATLTINDTEGTDIPFPDDRGVGIFRSTLEMLNKKGSFDNPPSEVRGIGFYEESINLLAQELAKKFNELNNLGGATDQDLLETNDGTSVITAKNIKVSDRWLKGEIKLNPSTDNTETGKNGNVLRMIAALNEKKPFVASNGSTIFNGTYQEYYANMESQMGLDYKSTQSLLDNYSTVARDIANMRSDVSNVQLDEEGINILQFQKSYNAAARLMTALDEAVGTIINNMGVVGR